MALDQLRKQLVARLEEGDRGDRGWFLITRVHLSPARLQSMASYLNDASAGADHVLQASDYQALATATGVTGDDPGITLRRHYLLAMERPLNLLRRVHDPSWREIRLTELGVALATRANTSRVLEQVLSQVVFCREPWYPESRVREYRQFEVNPYGAVLHVMDASEGWIDRDEYDLFVSRIRGRTEIGWAIDAIADFRDLDEAERASLLEEVRRRVPGVKRYQNWRDMALHTFSFFGLGTSAIRRDQRLELVARLFAQRAEPALRRRPQAPVAAPRPAPVLRVPEPHATPGLTTPPAPPAYNPGAEGEALIGKILEAQGWDVVFYTNRRGFGFDLWAHRGEAAMVVEVKSGFGRVGAVTLTNLEHEAARQYGANYTLAIVENLSEQTPVIYFIPDPARHLRIDAINTLEYRIARESWVGAIQPDQQEQDR